MLLPRRELRNLFGRDHQSPVPSKIVCIGLNFRDHAKESQMEIPKEPVIFFKATTSLVGPDDGLVIPKNGQKVDWEIELAVVVGKKGAYIERDEARICGGL